MLLVPRDVRACAAAARVAGRLSLTGSDIRVVARDSTAGSLKPADVAAHLGLPLTAHLHLDKDLDDQIESGRFEPHRRSHLGRTCATLLDTFGLYGREAA